MKTRLYLFFSSTEEEEKNEAKGFSPSVLRERLNLHPKLLRNFPLIKKKRVKLSKKEKKIRCRSSEEEEEEEESL